MPPSQPGGPGWYVLLFVGTAGLAGAITLLFHVMRSVMDVGGSCGSNGQYRYAVPCPDGVAGATLLAIFGGLVSLAVTAMAAWRTHTRSIVMLAWPALFISLGVNFLQYGISPPDGSGVEIGLLVCGVVFELMGGVPLLIAASIWRDRRKARSRPDAQLAQPAHAVAVSSPVSSRWVPTPGPLPSGPIDAGAPRPSGIADAPVVGDSATRSADGDDDPRLVERLQQLAELHRRGELTDAEFSAAKRAVLSEDS